MSAQMPGARGARVPRPPRPAHRCTECGWETAKWVGRCGECQAWGTVVEASADAMRGLTRPGVVTTPAVPIGEVPAELSRAVTCGVPELDRVLGGGLVPGAAILLAGEPGVGKSTLLLEVAAQTARVRRRTLYVTGEESAAQVRLRADRTGGVHDELYLAAETDLGAVLAHIEQVRPSLVVLDSVQTIAAPDTDGVPGGVTQVKEVASALVRVAKTRGITVVLVGHATKDGSIAGPRVLEHLVDVVLAFEGDRASRLRLVRAVKNRFGPVDEVGCFDLGDTGIAAVADPSGLFLGHHRTPVPGTCVTVTVEGRRPWPAEVQALVTGATAERPRRTVSGLESSRVALAVAVAQQHCGVPLGARDVFAASVGGARLVEPAADLATALALVSAHQGVALPPNLVAIGELGLAGEVRRVRDLPLRLAEAARLGFRKALVPSGGEPGGPLVPTARRERHLDGVEVVEVGNLASALALVGLGRPHAAARRTPA